MKNLLMGDGLTSSYSVNADKVSQAIIMLDALSNEKANPISEKLQLQAGDNQGLNDQLQQVKRILQSIDGNLEDYKGLLPSLPKIEKKHLGVTNKIRFGNESVDLHGRPVIRAHATPAYIGVSKAHYHNFRNPKSKYYQKDFPAVIELSGEFGKCKGHLKCDLDAWLESRKIKGDDHVSK